MLKLTATAAQAIKDMLEGEGLGEGAGMRLTAEEVDGEEAGLSMNLEPSALDGDETVTEHGVNVFLDSSAAAVLDGKVLDAELHGDHAHFGIEDQAE